MSAREWVGIALLIVAAGTAPFGHWVGFVWYLVALALSILGFLFIYTGRVARRFADPKALEDGSEQPGLPPGPNELRGFHGARIFGDRTSMEADHDE